MFSGLGLPLLDHWWLSICQSISLKGNNLKIILHGPFRYDTWVYIGKASEPAVLWTQPSTIRPTVAS